MKGKHENGFPKKGKSNFPQFQPDRSAKHEWRQSTFCLPPINTSGFGCVCQVAIRRHRWTSPNCKWLQKSIDNETVWLNDYYDDAGERENQFRDAIASINSCCRRQCNEKSLIFSRKTISGQDRRTRHIHVIKCYFQFSTRKPGNHSRINIKHVKWAD